MNRLKRLINYDWYSLLAHLGACASSPFVQPPSQENDKITEREFLKEFSLWVEIGGLVEENPNRTEQDWEDQIDSFLEEHHKQQERTGK